MFPGVSLVAQLVKNLPAVHHLWHHQSLGASRSGGGMLMTVNLLLSSIWWELLAAEKLRKVKVLVTQFCPDCLRPHEPQPTRLLCPWDSPGKHTGVGCHFLLQGIFPTEGSNLFLLHWEGDSLPLGQLGSLPSPGGLVKMQTWGDPPQSFWLLRPGVKPISCISDKFLGRCCSYWLGTMVWEPLLWIKHFKQDSDVTRFLCISFSDFVKSRFV